MSSPRNEGEANITADHKLRPLTFRVFSQELNATNCPPKLPNAINNPPI
ncbi:MAG: hypothetical protein ACTS4T_00815 [Candidatus Hodgkinia cicadicola]